MLEVRRLSAAYGRHPALNDVELTVGKGEIVVILGANGAGKSTLLRSIAGICGGLVEGEVMLGGQSLFGQSPDEIVERGVALVPEGRGIFGDLTVRENLILGAYPARARDGEAANLDRVMALFPTLRERQTQMARTMSGGEQQMVAIGRAMMSAPEILMLDEPSLGLSPRLCKDLFRNLSQVKELGIGVLLVEQNAKQSLAIADRGYLLENSRITHSDTADRLTNDPAVQAAYFGAGGQATGLAGTPSTETAEASPSAPVTDRPVHRRSAEQQIGGSIEDLVSIAARASNSALRKSSSDITAAGTRLASDRLAVVLKDIETAAKAARSRKPRPRRQDRMPESRHAVDDVPDADSPVPVIEVYRRPRVEVYRRRPSGQFEMD